MAGRFITRGATRYRYGTYTPPTLQLGAYVGTGQGDAGSLTTIGDFATATDTTVQVIQTYLPQTEGWTELTTEGSLASWLAPWSGTSARMMICVPMVTSLSGTPQNTLAEGSAGDENAYFTSFADNLVTLGFGNAILRLGWEQNIPSSSTHLWGINTDADALNYATYWQQIVDTMNAVDGANFKYMWSLARSQDDNIAWQWQLSDSYPGDAYVDYVGLDVYDQSYNTIIFPDTPDNGANVTVPLSDQVWNQILTGNSYGGTTSNLLSVSDSGFESGVGHWIANTNCSIAQSSAQAHSGSDSLEVTATASGFTNPRINYIDGIVPGATYTFSFWSKAATTGRAWTITAPWVGQYGGTVLSTSTITGVGSDTTSGWTLISGTAVAPAGAAKVSFSPSFTAGGASEVHYIDDAGIAGQLGSQGSLNWLVAFAQAHSKSIAIPEWAVMTWTDNSGLGDDPTFISNMYAWMVANQVALSSYFSYLNTPAEYDLIGGDFPDSLAEFESLFG